MNRLSFKFNRFIKKSSTNLQLVYNIENTKKSSLNIDQKCNISFGKHLSSNNEWTKILSKAEKIVGYPTSFLNLKYLVSDEVANFANIFRKLMQTKHPLLKMARRFLTSNDIDTKQSLQINGLIILLISKAAGIPRINAKILDSDLSDGIHHSQRAVAEIAEMIFMGSSIHKSVLDLTHIDHLELKQMDQGNKIAVLLGDFLLASACKNLSKIHNNEVVSMMSQVIADISQGIFEHKSDYDQEKMTNLKIWYNNINSNSSSLLAHSSKAAVLLVEHSTKLQDLVYNFAINLDITHKIWSNFVDIKRLIEEEKSVDHLKILGNNPDNIINAIYKDRYLIEEKNSIETALDECKLLFDHHYNQTMHILQLIEIEPNSEPNSISSLKSILNVMKLSI